MTTKGDQKRMARCACEHGVAPLRGGKEQLKSAVLHSNHDSSPRSIEVSPNESVTAYSIDVPPVRNCMGTRIPS